MDHYSGKNYFNPFIMSFTDKNSTGTGYNYGAVTPHATNLLAQQARALYIGGAGDIIVINPNGTAVTFVGVLAGTILPIQTSRVIAIGTTATNIVAIY